MRLVLLAVVLVASVAIAHNSYTGNYSGSPGKQNCASSCHGGTSGTIVVTGFPATYQPGQAYRIVVRRNGGSLIVNYNATTRVGTTSTVAGTFTTLTNSALYSGADGGVYASPHAIDSSVFQWTAPPAGTGTVNFYCAGFQGTTSSANGQSTRITLSTSESLTGVTNADGKPATFSLKQNYPNPFNPSTNIEFSLDNAGFVSLKVFDLAGKEVATLINRELPGGDYRTTFDASQFASGIYLYSLSSKSYTQTRKMVVTK